MKVIANETSKKTGIRIAELKRVAVPGEVFEIDEERFDTLTGGNKWGLVFVTKFIEPEEPAKTEVKAELENEVNDTVVVEEKPVVPEEKPAKKKSTKKKTKSAK